MRGELIGFGASIIILAVFSAILLLLLLLSDKVRAPKLISLPILTFSLTLIASAVASQVPEESFKKIFIYLASFIFFFVSYSLSHKYKKFLIWFLNIVFIIGLYIVLKFFIIEVLSQNLQAGGKFIGPFYWHNQMAGFLLYLIPFPLVNLFLNRNRKVLVWVIVLIFLMITLGFTYSRGAWLSLTIPIVAFFYLSRKKLILGRLSKITIFLAFLAGLLLLFNSNFALNRVKSIAQEILPQTRTTSGNLRASIYPSSIRAILDYPLLGVGPGVFGQALHKYQNQPWLYAANAHNHFLQIAVETGILGFFLFSLIFYQAVRLISKKKSYLKEDTEQSIYKIALIISLSASVIHNLIDTDWNFPSLSFLFWAILGILLGNLAINKKDAIPVTKSGKRLIVILMIIYSFFIFGLFSFNKQLERGKLFFIRKKLDNSLSSFVKIDKAFPYSYNSSIYTAKIYQERKDYRNALLYFKRASALNPFLAETDYSQGIIYSNLGQGALAEESFRAAIEKNPFSSPDYYKTLADIYVLGGENEKALEILAQAVNVAFPVNTSYKNLSYIYQITGFDRKLAHIYLSYAQLLASNGDFQKANRIVEIALAELEPESVKLKNLKSYIQEEL
jgi:O-antigen ligase